MIYDDWEEDPRADWTPYDSDEYDDDEYREQMRERQEMERDYWRATL